VTAATLIIDASALVKLLIGEPDSARFQAHVGDGTRLHAPAHVLAETGEVISRKMQAGHIDRQQRAQIVRQLEAELELIPLLNLLEPAIEIALDVGASVYDCLYVAAAARLRCKLLTADKRLIARLAGTPHQALLIALDSYTAPK